MIEFLVGAALSAAILAYVLARERRIRKTNEFLIAEHKAFISSVLQQNTQLERDNDLLSQAVDHLERKPTKRRHA